MEKYKKSVYRDKNAVVYKIVRIFDKSVAEEFRLSGIDLGFFGAMVSYERMIAKLFILAHKEADKAIKTLEEYEII